MKKFKRWSWIIVCVLLLCSLALLTGCDKDTSTGTQETGESSTEGNQPSVPDSVGLAYVVNEDGKTCAITGIGLCSDREIVIPETIDGYTVTSIGENAFYECKNRTSIIIPNSVSSIGNYAFFGCSSLTSITIPDNITNIGNGAFHSCSSLTSITIPDNITNIGDGTFYGCIGLTGITIPNSVTSIGWSAFGGCTNFENISIPDSVTSIKDDAFSHCTNLKSIIIPKSSKFNFREDAFEPNTTVFYTGTEKDAFFQDTDSNGGWNPHFNIYYYSSTQPTTSGNYWHYVDGEPTKW